MRLLEADRLGRHLLDEFGLRDWKFDFDRSVRRFGCCKYATRTISLSAHLVGLNDVERVERTIRHEIAHALAGPGAGHGFRWRVQCSVVGIPAERCYNPKKTNTPSLRYYAVCDECGHKFERARMTVQTLRGSYCASGSCKFKPQRTRTPLRWMDRRGRRAVA